MNMFHKILNRKMFAVMCLGLASGVPLGVVITLIQSWFTDAQIDIKTIGLISLVQFPYTFKFLWSPLMDRYQLPFLGRRQGWMLVSQIGMIVLISSLALFDPLKNANIIAAIAVAISFFGASHDIVIDAYKRDIFDEDELGFGSALSNNAYLVGYRFLATALGLAMAQFLSWPITFLILGAAGAIGVIGTFLSPKPIKEVQFPKNLRDAVILPFKDYLSRPGAYEIILFILLYKIGDNFAANLLTTFYLKIGYTKAQIAAMGKMIGFAATFIGGFIGGFFMMRVSIRKCLFWFGLLQIASTAGFAWLSEATSELGSAPLSYLGIVVGFENLTAGMGTAAYAAFMLRLCDRRFSATQFALLSSLMGVPRVFIPAWAGYIAEPFGWTNFFLFSTFIAFPGMLMIVFRSEAWEKSLPT